MNIPEKKIEEIRSGMNIVDVISEYVQLKKRGRNYIGLCPFHPEKTPSFTVSSDKQIYHCFGCHAGGNVFKFLMDYENISFIEAVQEVARRLGINIDYEESTPSEAPSEQEILYDINTVAAKFFSNNLLQSMQGQYARDYFESRKIKQQTQRIFGLGYALPEWESFVSHAKQNNIDPEKAALLGLIGKRENGTGYYDRFRDRIIFPIFSPNGRVIAFGGRIMEKSDNAAKYLNSPESPIYFKRKSLYGLYHSKEEIRRMDKAILVEGYIDLIALFQNGVKNVVASLGTALTEEQVQMLSRYTKNIVVFYDADPAGVKASLRSIEILVKQNFEVRIAELPAGEDPDSFVNKHGRQEFEEVMKRALNFLEYQTLQYEKQGLLNDPLQKAEAVRELIQSASFVNDELKRTLMLRSIAQKFSIREKLLEGEMEKYLQTKQRTAPKPVPEVRPVNNTPSEPEAGFEMPAMPELKPAPAELDIIKLLFEGDVKVIRYIFAHISPESLTTPEFQYLAELVYDAYSADEDILPRGLIDKIEDESVKKFVYTITVDKYSISKTWDSINPGLTGSQTLHKYAKDAIRNFRLYSVDRKIDDNCRRIESSESEEEKLELLKENNKLNEERKLIQKDL